MFVFFFHQRGCSACDLGMREINAFRARNYAVTFIFREVDGLYSEPDRDKIAGWRPRTTPGYAAVQADQLLGKHEGVLRGTALAKWVADCEQRAAAIRFTITPPPPTVAGKPKAQEQSPRARRR